MARRPGPGASQGWGTGWAVLSSEGASPKGCPQPKCPAGAPGEPRPGGVVWGQRAEPHWMDREDTGSVLPSRDRALKSVFRWTWLSAEQRVCGPWASLPQSANPLPLRLLTSYCGRGPLAPPAGRWWNLQPFQKGRQAPNGNEPSSAALSLRCNTQAQDRPSRSRPRPCLHASGFERGPPACA